MNTNSTNLEYPPCSLFTAGSDDQEACFQNQTNGALNSMNVCTFFGYMGISMALVFANIGAAYGTAKSGIGICSINVIKGPNLIFKSLIPGIMAGILGIYGLIVAVIYLGGIKEA